MTANIMLIAFTLLCAVGSWGTTIQGFSHVLLFGDFV